MCRFMLQDTRGRCMRKHENWENWGAAGLSLSSSLNSSWMENGANKVEVEGGADSVAFAVLLQWSVSVYE
jgi:hypothetical protein